MDKAAPSERSPMSKRGSLSTELVALPGEGMELRLSGRIDESSAPQLESAFSKLHGRARLDLRDVERINSYGLGILMRLLDRLTKEAIVEFSRLSEVMVDHFQMLDFSRYGRIISFY